MNSKIIKVMELGELIFELDLSGKRLSEVDQLLQKRWGSVMIVSRGKMVDAGLLPRITARDSGGKLIGLATFQVDKENNSCEIVSVDALVLGVGIGSELLKKVETEAKKVGCRRMWMITSNDNQDAAAFYIKRGYRLITIHLNALNKSRKLKSQIPLTGKYGIPLCDEWEFEKRLLLD